MNSPAKACCTPSAPLTMALTETAIEHANTGSTKGMKLLPGGPFLMGTDSSEAWAADGEGPIREVTIKPFFIDETAVTNKQFAAFVKATGFKTEAERFGWSFVFHNQVPKAKKSKLVDQTVQGLNWWCKVNGASWAHPEGPGSDVRQRQDHPAIHLTWNDAIAYCRWAGKRLLTEAEWEYAARGGQVQKIYPWGDDLSPGGRHLCNIWQGQFPHQDSAADGWRGTCPVRSFPANGFGLYEVSGNVWEWCSDWFSPSYHVHAPKLNPKGPPFGERKMMKGGSYLCHASYCNRYRVAARTSNTPDSSTGNCGFRCARDP
jgi:formylglycine-generating enzyme